MARFNMQSLEILLALEPDTGKWVVVNRLLNWGNKERRKTFEKFEDVALHIWELIYEHARTAVEDPSYVHETGCTRGSDQEGEGGVREPVCDSEQGPGDGEAD